MKKTLGSAIILFILLGAVILFRRTPITVSSSDQGRNTVTKSKATVHGTIRTPAIPDSSTVQSLADRSSLGLAPITDHGLYVWDNSGAITNEIIARYKLTEQQVNQLQELKTKCVLRMQSIDLANASIDISHDGKSVSITIKSDAKAAKEFTEFYQNSLLEILGAASYADLAKYYDSPSLDDTMNAGLVDKQIEVQKVTVNSNGALYHIKAESKLRLTPEGVAPS
ncbi:MAG: hypothetical protein ABI273_16090, partial [Lacunisphaera sp.]